MDENDITGDIYRNTENGELYVVKYSGMIVVRGHSQLSIIYQSLKHGHWVLLPTYDFFDGRFQYEGKINH